MRRSITNPVENAIQGVRVMMRAVAFQRWLILGFLFLFLGLQPLLASDTKGLLFELQRQGEPASYLFGTIHSEDPRVLDLPSSVLQALMKARTLVLEIPMEASEVGGSIRQMRLPAGQRLSDLVQPILYRQLRQVAADLGLNEQALQRLRPWALALLLSLPPPRTGEFLDLRLYKLARKAGKTTAALESSDEQLSLFDRLSQSDQVLLLQEALNNFKQLPLQSQQLVDAWLARDLGQLQTLASQGLGDTRLDRWFREQVVERRNRLMVQRLLPMTRNGPLLVAIGALHLPGERGMLQLLRAEGYRVTRRY